MEKIFTNRLVLLAFSTVLAFIFIFLSFFVWIIVRSDIADISANKMDLILLVKDLVFCLMWLCLIPLVIYCFKKSRKKINE